VNAETIAKVKGLMHSNQQITINEVVNEMGTIYRSVHETPAELQMRLNET
jgi:hypothetical protein